MHRKRSFLSAVLMLAYFIGFAHDAIPHVHETPQAVFGEKVILDASAIYKTDCNYRGLHHTVNQTDHNLLHLLACLLSNVDHPDGDCDLEICASQESDNRKVRSFIAIYAISSEILELWPINKENQSLFTEAYFFPISFTTPGIFDRGPPTLLV